MQNKPSESNGHTTLYLMRVQSHITWAVAAMDSCFGLIRPPQHVIAIGHLNNLKAMLSFTTETAMSC